MVLAGLEPVQDVYNNFYQFSALIETFYYYASVPINVNWLKIRPVTYNTTEHVRSVGKSAYERSPGYCGNFVYLFLGGMKYGFKWFSKVGPQEESPVLLISMKGLNCSLFCYFQ